jgi:formate hydrogenlyase subunit 4
MGGPVALQVLQSAVVVTVAPGYSGVMARAESIVASKRGPSIWQPYRDLAKLLRKGAVVSDQASWVFHGAPFVAFACYLTVSAIVPVLTNEPLPLAFLADLIGGAFVLALASFVLSLAGLDTASPAGGLGASRAAWIGSLAEPALILVFFTVGAVSASDNPYLMNHAVASSPYVIALPTHLLGLVAFFLLLLLEGTRIPVDNPSGTTEISMIEEGRSLEYSGREYALVKWGGWMKLFLLSSIFMNVFVLPWGLGSAHSVPDGLLAILALLGKLALCGAVIVVIDSSFAKLRFFRIAEFVGAAFLLALVGIATSYVIGA